ncbi:hypothetical protein [Peribacillus sp. SCS-155]|uniref:hypothetical protein n=1 Tax=Peribacillus sedimenti TaxID=3115297 RepID=UPI003905BADA
MLIFYILLFLTNVIGIVIVYSHLFQRRKLIGFQLGMTISMVSGGFFALVAGVILIYVFPFYFVYVTIGAAFVGMITGSLFGGLFDYQTLLSGYTNGLMVGIMSPMIGAIAKNSGLFLLLVEALFLATLMLVLSSAKRT